MPKAQPALPVAILGAGPVGLVLSILLSLQEIPHEVFEQFPGTSIYPKACGLNQRTVEIFRQIGIEDEVIKHRAPLQTVSRTGWYTDVGPNCREIISRDAWGCGQYKETYYRASPCQYSTLPQIRMEPNLQHRAMELNPKGIHYNTKVEKVHEEEDRVVLTLARNGGETVEAQYLLGADGGRGLAESLGIGWEGAKDIADMVTSHFKADISTIHPDERVFISWIMNPQFAGSPNNGGLYHLGPYYPPKKGHDEWALVTPRRIDDPEQLDKDTMVARIRKTLDRPELDIELLSLSHWTVNAKVTERYRSSGGRVFLVGDAAHRFPPWGALGFNTGSQDANNLVWKLAMSLKSGDPHKYDALLDSYEEERREISQRIAKHALKNMRSHADVMAKAVGITYDSSVEERRQAFNEYFNPQNPQYVTKQEKVREACHVLDNEFNALGIEIGWFYPSADINDEGKANRHDGQLLEDGEFDVLGYHPSTIPGHNVPHTWLEKGGVIKSTRDLSQQDRFVLLTETSGVWDKAEGPLVHVEVIDGKDGWEDRNGTWEVSVRCRQRRGSACPSRRSRGL